jgi:NAD(P)-dependent dehydrogenase (short-subunit alcohol dehydrogenase family)
VPDPTPLVGSLLDLTGRVALVTGAGAGIGAAIALRLAEAGAAVVVHYRSNGAGAGAVADRIGASGGRALTGYADLTVADEVDRLFDAATDMLGLPDIVVNNAGAYPLATLIEMSEEDWTRVLDSNVKSVHLVTQAAARRLVAAGEPGSIVNIASIEASNAARLHAHYAAAKAAVVMYTKTAALELGPAGIRVNAVSPGLIWREGLDEAWPDGVGRYRAAAPLGRLGEAADVADACLFLVSLAARWISGIELVVDGGVLTNTAY